LELGAQPAERCPACTDAGRPPARWWLDDQPLRACPTCDGELVQVDERRQKTVSGFATQRAAQAALNEAMVSQQRGSYITPAKLTVHRFLVDEWLPAIEGARRPSTYASYKQHVDDHLVPLLGGVRLQKLAPAAIDAAYRRMDTEGKGRGRNGLSPATIQHVHVTLHAALDMAVARHYVVFNAADAASPPRPRGGDRHEMKTWSGADVKAFLAHVREDRHYTLWRLMAVTGLRRGEAARLRWEDVLFIPAEAADGDETARLSVRHTLVAVGYRIIESEPKTDRGRRTVPLDSLTTAALREQIQRQQDDRAEWKAAWIDSGLVFTAESSAALHPDRITKLFGNAVRRAPVPRIRLHDLRHTVATRMLEAGVPAKVVSEILGHASVAFTLDRYSHAIPALQENAVGLLAELYAK
jgi:integrase